jgi:hypothetical protein
MSTSGTISQTVIDVMQLIEHGARRCGNFSEELTVEQIQSARESLYFALSSLGNRGISYWAIQKSIVGTRANKGLYTLPVGSIDVLNALYRRVTRNTGAYSASTGTAANAFDGDVDTSCTQTAINGNIAVTFSDEVYASKFGILPGVSGSFTVVIEYSTDGTTWSTLYAPGITTWVDNTWLWYDIDPGHAVMYYRMRETAGGTLIVREFVVGSNPIEIPMARLNRDDYTNLPNKNFTSNQPLQYWFDRTIPQPTMNVWPVPSEDFTQIVVYCSRYIMDVGDLNGSLEIPQRWYEAILFILAHRMSLELPDVPMEKIMYLDGQADKYLAQAEDEERDNSPIFFSPNISGYSR